MAIVNDKFYNLSFKLKQPKLKTRVLHRVICSKLKSKNLEVMSEILQQIIQNSNSKKRKIRKKSSINCLNTLKQIIPNQYFGSTQNRKLFFSIVKKILTQSSFEFVPMQSLTEGYDLSAILWLSHIENREQQILNLRFCNIIVLNFVVKPFIRYLYKPVRNCKNFEIKFERRDRWLSYEDKVFRKLIKEKYLRRSRSKARGVLCIIKKGEGKELNFRTIVSVYKSCKDDMYKYFSSRIYKELRKQSNRNLNLYESWRDYCDFVRDRKLYGIALDIKDAYGNVDREILFSAILKLKSFTLYEKHIMLNYIDEQSVTFRKKSYCWLRGLIQGDQLSAPLCELYLWHLDKLHVEPFAKKQDCFLHRTVDDYFFCSTDPKDVSEFLKVLKSIHVINEDKTKSNVFAGEGSVVIPYCGNLIDLSTRNVRIHFKFDRKFSMRYKFMFYNSASLAKDETDEQFIERIIPFKSNNYYLKPIYLNTEFNSECTVLQNIFDAMVYVAFKFDSGLQTRLNKSLDFVSIFRLFNKNVKYYSMRIFGLIKDHEGNFFSNLITVRLLRRIVISAFVVVLKKRSKFYEQFLPKICKADLKPYVPTGSNKYFRTLPNAFKDVRMKR